MPDHDRIPKTVAADFDAVVAQMAALRAEMAKMAQHVQGLATARGHDLAQDIIDSLAEAATFVTQKGHDADHRVEGAVAANPYLALGLAAGLGVLLGAMVRR